MTFQIARVDEGLTLIELLISISILGVIATVLSTLLITTFKVQGISGQQAERTQTARLAMERMVAHTRRASRVLLPLDNLVPRTVLAIDGVIDNDGDGRYDEDPPADLTADGAAGIIGIDDDQDGLTDEGMANDDDEDGQVDEDLVNGLDDDVDGRVDEDPAAFLAPPRIDNDGDTLIDEDPVNTLDDDLDGLVDEDPPIRDDDRDGLVDEDPIEPIVYYWEAATKTLWERYPLNSTTSQTSALAEQVETFQIQRQTTADGLVLVEIVLRLADEQGQMIELRTQVFPHAMRQ